MPFQIVKVLLNILMINFGCILCLKLFSEFLQHMSCIISLILNLSPKKIECLVGRVTIFFFNLVIDNQLI